MKHRTKRVVCFSLLLALLLSVTAALPAFAAAPFDNGAYATVLTCSDVQDVGTKAYERFGRLLGVMKKDDMPVPDSMLVGGDYTKLLFDYAAPGVTQLGQRLKDVYPTADADSIVCIQGNHDNMFSGFTKTGFYDNGPYSLYVINEDDFPWQQGLRPGVGSHIKKIAADLEKNLNALIEAGDRRPVFVMTHLPLHHTNRARYADNKYAAYLFDVLNEAGKTLDIVFLFGHQHSGDYDDYIGGSVNFMKPGDTIRVPLTDKQGEDAYTEETLSFTYTNCGYVGYSNNHETDTSTNALTLGAIAISEENLRFIKYTEEGVYGVWNVARQNPAGDEPAPARTSYPAIADSKLWHLEQALFDRVFAILRPFLSMLGIC